MSRSKSDKYEVFNISTGEMEEMDFCPDDFFDQLAAKVADQSAKLYDIYKAEREIVESILNKAVENEETRDRSTD